MDVNNIGPGDEFADVLDRTLEATDVMLVVIGKSWSQVTDKEGRLRLDDRDDYVRREIVRALELNFESFQFSYKTRFFQASPSCQNR